VLAAAGISWPLPERWHEKRVEQALFGERLLALELYREDKVSLGRAAELCQRPLAAFMDFAAKHAVPHYGTALRIWKKNARLLTVSKCDRRSRFIAACYFGQAGLF
jgi:hypothetical protein